MPDYRQSLEFGAFLTPRNTPATDPVDHAVLCERLGYDLVTFQDHPYQPRFLDTWTLLTWVAARTERIRVSDNVLNLLSGGRFDLALGAGGFLGRDRGDGRSPPDPG